MMFTQSWAFDYESSDSEKPITEKFILSDTQNECLFQFLGIEVIMHEQLQLHELLDLAATQMGQGLPVLAWFDSYYNSWDPLFGKEHNNHMCLITGMDIQNQTFTICDPYFGKQNEVVPFQVIDQASGRRYAALNILPVVEHQASIELLYASAQRFMQENGLRHFASDIENNWTNDLSFIWNQESGGLFWNSKFYRLIKNVIILDRHKFKELVLYYIDKEGHNSFLQSIIDQIHIIITHWEAALNMMTKAIVTSSITAKLKTNFITKVNNVVQLEHSLAQMIYSSSFDSGKLHPVKDTMNAEKHTDDLRHVPLDLSRHMNNRGFSYELSAACTADITGTGEYVYVNSGQMESSTFNMPTIGSDMMDNIACMGQVLPVDPLRCKGIAILGCSEWGDSSAFLTIIYQDGTEKNYPVILTDFINEPRYNESVEMKLSLVDKNDNLKVSDAYLFRVMIYFEENEVIDFIQLPVCSNMHIIAMNMLNVHAEQVALEPTHELVTR
ncbi:hypothetical protein HUB94_09040 [Paenibacillus cellulosilyticus]|nr:hypothetical protein HUB94_09040 [Paenibacillus cellulosilyticus]